MPKQLVLVGDHVCDWQDYEDGPLEPNRVRITTEVASGKYGTWATIVGDGPYRGHQFDTDLRLFLPDEGAKSRCPTPEEPVNFGTAAAGVVSDIGSDVAACAVGDRVVVLGGARIATTNTAARQNVYPLGDLDPVLALCAEPAYVAFHCVRESNLRYGDSVIVVGLGALGLIAVSMACQTGAEKIIAADLSAGRRELAKRLGAQEVLDPADCDVGLAAHELTGGQGVDVAIELSGSTRGLEAAIRSTRLTGTVCSAGFYRTDAEGLWLSREWHHNRLTIVVPHGCGWGHPPRDYPRWDERRAYEAILSMMSQGRLPVRDVISAVVGPDDATDMFRRTRDEPDQIVKFAVEFA